MTPSTGRKAAPAQTPDTYVAQVFARLYPPPLHLQSLGRVKSTDTLGGYLLLPSPRHPRIVVPSGHSRAGARAVHRQLTGSRRRTQAARWLLTLALASGVLDLLSPGRLTIRGPAAADSVERRLARVLEQPSVLITMPVGLARASRKPVLQVTDLAGTALAFVKVGHDDLTRALVQDEGLTLERLAGAQLRHTRVPGVLARLDWRDLTMLVLEPLPVVPQLNGQQAREALLLAVREIAGLSEWHGEWSDSPFRSRLQAALVACGPRGAEFLQCLHDLTAAAPGVSLGSWHGDLNPGNVALLPDRVLMWDWERFEDAVPIGFDLLHHDLHHAITVDGSDPRTAAHGIVSSAPHLLASLGVEPRAARATAQLYLLALAARYLHDDQEAAGAALGRVEEWIIPVLQANLGDGAT